MNGLPGAARRPELWLVLVTTVALGLAARSWPLGLLDEPILVALPQRMLHGDMPYRDFSTVYGPAHWLFLTAVYAITSPTVSVERWTGLLLHVVIVTAVYAWSSRDGRPAALVSAATAALLLFPLGSGAYAWVGMVGLLWTSLALLRRSSGTIVAGVLSGLAVGFRPDAALLVLVPCGLLAWSAERLPRWVLGLLIGATPTAVLFVLSPGEMLHDVLGRAVNGAGQSSLPIQWGDSAQSTLLLAVGLTVALSITTALTERSAEALAVASLTLLALPQTFQRAETVHFLYGGLVALPALPGVVTTLLRRSEATRANAGLTGPLLAAVIGLLASSSAALHPLLAQLRGEGPASETVSHAGRRLPVAPSQADGVRAALHSVDAHARPGDRFFVFDEDLRRPAYTDVRLYLLLPELTTTAFNVELSPGLSNAPGSRLERDVMAADVLLLLRPSAERRQANYPHEKDGPAVAAEVLRTGFCQVDEGPSYAVYRRCAVPDGAVT